MKPWVGIDGYIEIHSDKSAQRNWWMLYVTVTLKVRASNAKWCPRVAPWHRVLLRDRRQADTCLSRHIEFSVRVMLHDLQLLEFEIPLL